MSVAYRDLYVVISFEDEWNWSQAALYCCGKSIGQDKETHVHVVRKSEKYDRFMISVFKKPVLKSSIVEELTPFDLQHLIYEFKPEAICYYDRTLREKFVPSLFEGAGV